MEVPVLSLPQAVLDQLVQHLEPQLALGKDWKGLAGVIGFNARHTAFIAARKSDSTRTLLIAWGQSGRSTVEKLVLALLCLGREDCIRILQSSLPGLDLTQLRATAARIKDNYTERDRVFPPFGDDYIICSDGWPTATVQSPPTHMTSEPLRRESLSATPPLSSQEDVPLFIQRETRPARSPEEEAPSLSVHPSEATDVVPSKEKVFISYYPESSTRSSMASLVGDLEQCWSQCSLRQRSRDDGCRVQDNCLCSLLQHCRVCHSTLPQ
ncbi:hypothetical protein GBAR_LOCUS14640 [Geodia barretti]|uniref:Death domain-containing protein n=1 Tax=Geodia barretti TaxID=519541 RepID=A0AA35S8A0_GEOBA|nr:hypothetical protein GBAR_LOCUS14640 [Geodia barretti]